MDPEIEGDFSFSMEIVKQNVRIPLILIDECHDVLQTRNLSIPLEIEKDLEKKKTFILKELETMKKFWRFNIHRCFWRKTKVVL